MNRKGRRTPPPPPMDDWSEDDPDWEDDDSPPALEDPVPQEMDVTQDVRWDTTGDSGVSMLAASWLDRATGSNGGFRRGFSAEYMLAHL